eukprot:4021574-Ditylum_brightwellii.AAC.1
MQQGGKRKYFTDFNLLAKVFNAYYPTFTVPNIGGYGLDASIQVNKIDRSDAADVSICIGPCEPDPPSVASSSSPSISTTVAPVVNPTTTSTCNAVLSAGNSRQYYKHHFVLLDGVLYDVDAPLDFIQNANKTNDIISEPTKLLLPGAPEAIFNDATATLKIEGLPTLLNYPNAHHHPITEGQRSVFAVCVVVINEDSSMQLPLSEYKLANSVFGNKVKDGNDTVNLHNLFYVRSYGKLEFIPAKARTKTSNYNSCGSDTLSNGVVTFYVDGVPSVDIATINAITNK